MQAVKQKSGNWSIRVYLGKNDEGRSIFRSVTAKTRKEAFEKANALLAKAERGLMRVGDAVEAFLDARKAVLSPNTYRSYVCAYNQNIKDTLFSEIPLDLLRDSQVQKWVSGMAKGHNPKTVKNVYGLFTAAVRFYLPEKRFNVKLPQVARPKLHTPSTAEVRLVLDAAEKSNPELYKAILLAAVGTMRQGEIAALTADNLDFDRCTISVTKSLALTSEGDYVIKPPKNDSSNRIIKMPKSVMDRLPREGKTVKMNPNAIALAFAKLIKKTDVTPFRFHDLRHYSVSVAASSSIGAATMTLQNRGGWSTDGMMKRVYFELLNDEKDKDTNAINTYFEQNFS